MHHYQFEVDDEFFSLFEDSPLQDGKMKFEIDFDKRADMLLIDFRLEGSVRAECDRCTAMMADLPLQDERQLIVKYGEDEGEEEDEVVFISREASDFNLAQYLYEFSVLALPIRNAYDCQKQQTTDFPCNFEVLDFLEKEEKNRKRANPAPSGMRSKI